MKLIMILSIFIFVGCSNDDSKPSQNLYTHYWQTRHDPIPKEMQGEWVSINDNSEFVLNVTDRFVTTKDFTVSPEQGNAVDNKDGSYTVYQNGHIYTLAFGSNEHAGQITITVDNKCYGTVIRFQQQNNLN